MAKVTAQSEVAVAAAHAVLAEAGVAHPREIDAAAIAGRNGARILYGPVATSRANIVRAARRAIIFVDESARGTPHERTSIAHELGHHQMHDVADHFTQCDPEQKRSGTSWRIEREAFDFARELLAPAFFAAKHVKARPSLDDLDRFVRVFPMAIETAAIRYVQLADAAGIPCAGALVRDGRIKWAVETRAFEGRIVKGRAAHAQSLAARVHAAQRDRGGAPREVPGEAWGAKAPLAEQAIHLGASGEVLSWIVPA